MAKQRIYNVILEIPGNSLNRREEPLMKNPRKRVEASQTGSLPHLLDNIDVVEVITMVALRFMRISCVFCIVTILLCCPVVFGAGHRERKRRVARLDWPEELSPYRAQAKTTEIAWPGNQEKRVRDPFRRP